MLPHSLMMRKEIQPFSKYDIFETKIGAKKKCIANGPKITHAKFGAKMFVRVRDTAANVMYYAMGNPLHSYVRSPIGLPDYY